MDKLRAHLSIGFLFLTIMLTAQQTDNAKLANEYYLQGDYEKAIELFDKLAKQKTNIAQIHSNYFDLLVNMSEYEKAEKYLTKAIKFYPSNLQYKADLLFLFKTSGKQDEQYEYQIELIAEYEASQFQLNLIAQNLVNHEMYNSALVFLQSARRANGNQHSFALDMAALYRTMNDKEAMTNEYINYAMTNPRNVNYIKNIFQTLLMEEEDLLYLERTLISKVQDYPEQMVYAELLLWVALQQKNFRAAFIQARSMDKRNGKPGDEVMNIAKIARDNKAFDEAIDFYRYVIDEYQEEYNYEQARQLLIKTKEERAKNTFPIDKELIRNLSRDYTQFYNELGPNPITLEALRNKALLHAFYLDERDSAIYYLNQIINLPRVHRRLVSQCKLSLGDIYILSNEPWEASLLYSQVEKTNKYATIGYEAKLRNAKLHYFTGNFNLAKAHLDVLKKATTKEISNDAIDLSILIDNNTEGDSLQEELQAYANVELLIYQNKLQQASRALKLLIRNYPGHSIIDQSLWQLHKVELQLGNYELAVQQLDRIIEDYPKDVLGDDAHFVKAEIFEKYLDKEEEAKALYREFLTTYPGSAYTAEARKRYRYLRGDLIN